MTRTLQLLLVAACVLAMAGTAWFALRDSPASDAPRADATTSASPVVETTPRPRDAAAKARADDAHHKTANPPARWLVHVVAAEDDAPIRGAQIDVSGEPDWPRKATVDSNGDVRVDVSVLAPVPDVVKVRLRVGAPGRVREVVRTEVASGKTQEETVRLRRAFGVDGLVHDAFDRPIAGARVSAYEQRDEAKEEDDAPRPEVADAVSGDDGRFRIEGLPVRTPLEFDVAAPRHVTKRISRRAHDGAPLDVRLDAAGVVRGVVRSPTGAPVSGARVLAGRHGLKFSNDGPELELTSAPTGADGRFEIDALPLGKEWTFVAGHDDFMDSDRSLPIAFTASGAEASCDLVLRAAGHLDVELASAVQRDAWVAQLRWRDGEKTAMCSVPGRASRIVREPGAVGVDVCGEGLRHVHAEAEVGPGETRTLKLEIDEGDALSGVVLDDEGAPVPGAVVTVDPERLCEQHATSAADGTFAMKGLAQAIQEIHEIRATAQGHGACDKTGVATSVTWIRLHLPRDGEVALRLRVPDGAARPGKRKITWTGRLPVDEDVAPWSDGRVVRPLPPAMWSVAVEVDGYVTWRPKDAFFVVAGQRTDLGEAVLDPGLPLSGRVVDVDGNGVPYVDVSVDGDLVETDATGQFKAAHVAYGYHEIGTPASPDFLATAPTRIRLDRDAPPIVLTVHRGAVLRVTLHGTPKSAMESGVNVDVVPIDPPDERASVGLFKEAPDLYSARLHDGSRRIAVHSKTVTLATKDVVLRDGVDVSVDIDLAN